MRQERIQEKSNSAIIRPLTHPACDRMAVNTSEGLHIVRYTDIAFCEAMSNYSRIQLADGRAVLVSKPLKQVVGILPRDQFIRVHQSYLVRFENIMEVGESVVLLDGKTLPVSRSRRKALMQRLRTQMHIL